MFETANQICNTKYYCSYSLCIMIMIMNDYSMESIHMAMGQAEKMAVSSYFFSSSDLWPPFPNITSLDDIIMITGYNNTIVMEPAMERATVTFECPPQYILTGPNTTTCMENGNQRLGKWNAMIRFCWLYTS